MDSAQITHVLMNDEYVKPYFAGVCAHDQLQQYIGRNLQQRHKIGIIYNLDPRHLPGSHWVAIYLDFTTDSAEYFDSMGLAPDPACHRLLQDICPRHSVRYNNIKLQDDTLVCGKFCITFLKYRCRGHSFNNCVRLLDFKDNDRAVYDLIKTWIPNLPYKL